MPRCAAATNGPRLSGAHDAPTAKLAAHLEAAVDAQEVPPGGRAGLALEEIAEDDAVAPHVLARAGFQEVVG